MCAFEIKEGLHGGERKQGRDWITRLCAFLRVVTSLRGIISGISKCVDLDAEEQ